MCLMISASAAVITTAIWYLKVSKREYALGKLALMYWGATLMWLVDGFFHVAEGNRFLEITVDDAILGGVIVLCGFIAWLVMLLSKDVKKLIIR